MTEKNDRQKEYFANRIKKNEHALRKWIRREGIDAVRLYDRDIPEIPLALDRYGQGSDAALVLFLYKRPYDKPWEEEELWLSLMAAAAGEVLEVGPDRIFIKTRQRQKGTAQYEKVARTGFELKIRESGLSFIVNLSDYLDTGLFLDHRKTRMMIQKLSAGKSVLNLFSYTGSFTAHALSGGALDTVSVDISTTYLAWAERNFVLNGFEPARFSLIRADVPEFLADAFRSGKLWDLIILDPPTYSNSKRALEDMDLNKDWRSLLECCSRCLAPEGKILFSTNSRSLRWEAENLPLPCREITQETLSPDFRDQKVHRAWLLWRE